MPAAHVLEAGANRCAHATGQSVRAETGPSPPYARRSRRRARCRMHRPRRRGCTPVASIAARVRSPPMTAEPAPGRSSVGTGSGRFLARRSHGATSCAASRSIPFLLTLPAFTEARPEHRRFGRRSPPVADVAVRRNVVPGARAPPDTLEGDAGGLCRPRARYSARGAPRRCMRGKIRADAGCHASCAAPDAAALPPARAGRRMAKAATRPRLAASARPGSAVWPQNPSFTSRPRRYGTRHFFSSRTCRRFLRLRAHHRPTRGDGAQGRLIYSPAAPLVLSQSSAPRLLHRRPHPDPHLRSGTMRPLSMTTIGSEKITFKDASIPGAQCRGVPSLRALAPSESASNPTPVANRPREASDGAPV